jgi:multidrug efflux pump subunit AcrA (membrane-fusion protein)
MCHMSQRARHPHTPSPDSFRRRFPLELTPAECQLLEREGRRAGTKRAALLAGLEALQEQERLTQALTQLETERDTLHNQLAERDKAQAKLERQLATANKDARVAQTQKRTASRRDSEAREQAEERADAYAKALHEERDARAELEAELDDLRGRAVDELYCHRCSKWIAPADWAAHEDNDTDLLYHRQCGFHQGTALTETSILALRRI